MEVNDGRVISNFINQALDNKDITIYGDGTQTRSFCYIDDMILGLTSLMNSNYQKPVNLGMPFENSIFNIAKKILSKLGSSSKIIYKDLPENDPLKRQPNISLAKEIIGFEPKVSFEKVLRTLLVLSVTCWNLIKILV